MLLKLYEKDTNVKHIRQVTDCLCAGGTVIFPTDTIYAVGCSLSNQKGITRIRQMKIARNSNLSLICNDLSSLSNYARPISNHIFKLMKKNLPGPFTFILEANSNVPKIFKDNKKTIGIRIPDNVILQEILKELGDAIVSTSIHDEDEIIEYTTDPELIHERYNGVVDMVVDGGYGSNVPSTVVDCTSGEPVILRQGLGELIS